MAKVKSENQKFWTMPLVTFAIVQFIFYLLIYCAGYYLEFSTLADKTFRVGLIVAVVLGVFTSIQPALARDEFDNIRNGKESNSIYYGVIIPFVIFIISYLAVSYYEWSFPISKKVLTNFCLLYFCGAPAGTYLLRMIKCRIEDM
ncbi:hypothetical protein H8C17_002628 [Salmonella enterica]|nr:hypothetical protein [Salmonella enterica]